MPGDHGPHGGFLPGGRRAEADAARMVHEYIACQFVLPSLGGGPHAEIVFFAVAFAEGFDVEQPGLRQTFPANIHAKADRGRDLHRAATIYRGENRVERGEVGGREEAGYRRRRLDNCKS